ncbi:MAG: type II secretion system F family protein [Gammaproteobacteria bacterium]|nr:type II secretion system F family protein [Gammaproteobacteria bacterium]
MAQAAAKANMFVWEGTDRQGRKVKGEMSGNSDALVKAVLRRQGINPVKVKKKSKPLFGGNGGKKITTKDIAVFSRQMATMMSSGVPLVQSFEIVGRGHENPRMQDLVLNVKAEVEAGNTLGDSLAKHPLYFDNLFVNLVRAGEAGGILETLLDKIATYKEKTEAIKGKIKKAMFYPAAVLIMAFVITAVLMIFVIPQFGAMFKDFGAELPALTKMVMSMSDFFVEYWWAIFGGIGGVIFGFISLKKRSKRFRDIMDRVSLKLPVLGDIVEKATIARFARTLSTMFAAGVPLVEAMDSVAGAAGNLVYGNAILRMRDEIATGQQLQVAMRDTGLFPNMVVQMVAIGEESGSIDQMLGKVADFYEEEVDNAVDAMSSLIEPMIMAILGVLIGGLVVAMYLPIFKMGEVVG